MIPTSIEAMNDPVFQRVTIVGVGAIGGWLGALLAQAGCTVSAIARGETLAALQRDGLHLRSGDSEQTLSVQAVADGGGLGPQDLVIVAVKAPALAGVAPPLVFATTLCRRIAGAPFLTRIRAAAVYPSNLLGYERAGPVVSGESPWPRNSPSIPSTPSASAGGATSIAPRTTCNAATAPAAPSTRWNCWGRIGMSMGIGGLRWTRGRMILPLRDRVLVRRLEVWGLVGRGLLIDGWVPPLPGGRTFLNR